MLSWFCMFIITTKLIVQAQSVKLEACRCSFTNIVTCVIWLWHLVISYFQLLNVIDNYNNTVVIVVVTHAYKKETTHPIDPTRVPNSIGTVSYEAYMYGTTRDVRYVPYAKYYIRLEMVRTVTNLGTDRREL